MLIFFLCTFIVMTTEIIIGLILNYSSIWVWIILFQYFLSKHTLLRITFSLFRLSLILLFDLFLLIFFFVRKLSFIIYQSFDKYLSEIIYLVLSRLIDIKNQWSYFSHAFKWWIAMIRGLLSLRWNIHIHKIVFKSCFTLYSSVSYFAYLITVESRPLFWIKPNVKINNEYTINEVDKGITHIALVLKVDWKVEKVVLVFMILINQIQQHSLRVFIWNVLYHYCSSCIFS